MESHLGGRITHVRIGAIFDVGIDKWIACSVISVSVPDISKM